MIEGLRTLSPEQADELDIPLLASPTAMKGRGEWQKDACYSNHMCLREKEHSGPHASFNWRAGMTGKWDEPTSLIASRMWFGEP